MYRLILTTLMAIATIAQVAAQDTYRYKRHGEYKDDTQARWAIDAHIGGNATIGAHHSGGNAPLYRIGSTSQTGMLTSLHAEYYIPGTQWSVKGGYEHEEISYLKGDINSDLNQLMVGGRWRPVPGDWWVQPYVGADVLWAIDAERHELNTDATLSQERYQYHIGGTARMPRFSAGPVVGADIYIFSHIALQAQYGFRLGFCSHSHADYTDNKGAGTTVYHGQIHRHVLSVGLKVDFPFHFTEGDGRGLLQGILDSY